jgi:putative PIN family toxin of toxin-antitoxin system
VLVSGIISPNGPPGRIVDAILSAAVIVLHDDRILGEYREVLTRPSFGFDSKRIDTLLDYIESTGEHISARQIDIVLPDLTDLPFVEVAIAGQAVALITGNIKHFQPTRGRHRMYVCTPADFIRRLLQ